MWLGKVPLYNNLHPSASQLTIRVKHIKSKFQSNAKAHFQSVSKFCFCPIFNFFRKSVTPGFFSLKAAIWLIQIFEIEFISLRKKVLYCIIMVHADRTSICIKVSRQNDRCALWLYVCVKLSNTQVAVFDHSRCVQFYLSPIRI